MVVEPIRDKDKILGMKKVLRQRGGDYELLFIMGLNTALRIGDLLSLSIADVTNGEGKVLDVIHLRERKTGKQKRLPVNKTLKKALTDYMIEHPDRERSEPLFTSRKGSVLSRTQAWRVLKAAGKYVGLGNIGTHSLRKTFGYHVYKNCGDINLLQKLLNHSAAKNTLRYIGIDRDKMDNVYMKLNL